MTSLRAHSADLLSGALAIQDAHPMQPLLVAEQVADRAYFVSSFANVTALDTDDGLVLVDTGSFLLADKTRQVLRGVTPRPAIAAIWTHGHVDHCFGVEDYEREAGHPVRVIAHEAVRRRFERYELTHGYNQAINARQFQTGAVFPSQFRAPDETYRDRLALEVGGRRFELAHALGETDDATWVWVPDAGVACVGDLFIWASPNCGNPQKVQRYPREWAQALRAIDALRPEVLCPGHGVPIWGAAAVHRALDETASYLESIVDQVVTLMNRGERLDAILGAVRVADELVRRPYLQPIYDEPEFIVRNVYRLYGGWWDGNPAHLKPPRDADLARELADLAGGPLRLADRAEQVHDPRLACELVELASLAAPDDARIRLARQRIYTARRKQERSLMARGIFGTAAEE
ncbi:MAG TPA: alkyl sulfatase dimerization domain-containing protein [Kofleriaceae bacterium]|nr:alkyl sulfatase dimerization domain-containing protein [Kofleriaceae bacterium]